MLNGKRKVSHEWTMLIALCRVDVLSSNRSYLSSTCISIRNYMSFDLTLALTDCHEFMEQQKWHQEVCSLIDPSMHGIKRLRNSNLSSKPSPVSCLISDSVSTLGQHFSGLIEQGFQSYWQDH